MRIVSSVFWVVSAIGCVAACLAFLGMVIPHKGWRSLALMTAVIFLVGLIPFIGNWPAFNTLGAVGINVGVLVALSRVKWPSETLIGR